MIKTFVVSLLTIVLIVQWVILVHEHVVTDLEIALFLISCLVLPGAIFTFLSKALDK